MARGLCVDARVRGPISILVLVQMTVAKRSLQMKLSTSCIARQLISFPHFN